MCCAWPGCSGAYPIRVLTAAALVALLVKLLVIGQATGDGTFPVVRVPVAATLVVVALAAART